MSKILSILFIESYIFLHYVISENEPTVTVKPFTMPQGYYKGTLLWWKYFNQDIVKRV